MENIKAIETVYNGYRFRSRLEARWAVFFDALGIKYQYEPEGFELKDGTKYLPDFYFPELNYYAEVKGMSEHIIRDIEKVERFVEEKKTAIIVLSEIPYDKRAKGLYWFPILTFTAKTRKSVRDHACFISNDDVYIEDDYGVGCRAYWYFTLKTEPKKAYREIQAISGFILDDHSDNFQIKDAFDLRPIENALLTARQARFEHNERNY